MRAYIASSFRNPFIDEVIWVLRYHGITVFDFRSAFIGPAPAPWRDITGLDWRQWTIAQWREAATTRPMLRSLLTDLLALELSDILIFVAPAGKSASWELGRASGLAMPTHVLADARWSSPDGPALMEPELMFSASHLHDSLQDMATYLGGLQAPRSLRRTVDNDAMACPACNGHGAPDGAAHCYLCLGTHRIAWRTVHKALSHSPLRGAVRSYAWDATAPHGPWSE